MPRPKKKPPTSAETIGSELDDDLEADHSSDSTDDNDRSDNDHDTSSRSVFTHVILMVLSHPDCA